MSTGHIIAPMPLKATQRNLRLLTSQDLYTNVNANLVSKASERPASPIHHIHENDYSVPDAPPPSPVMFRSDLWPASVRH